jgi:hypothetical protein
MYRRGRMGGFAVDVRRLDDDTLVLVVDSSDTLVRQKEKHPWTNKKSRS